MASTLDVGYVSPAGQDVLPTTGPHLDVRVSKDGKYIDPGTIRSLLTRLKVGKERKALWQQQGEQWTPGFSITSGYGPREAPVAGASTFHPAHDYGVAGGTPLSWEGPGTFIPGKGYGTIKTTDTQGTPYEIRLLHTKGGKPAETTDQIAAQPDQQKVQTPAGNTYIYVLGKQKNEDTPEDFLSSYIQNALSGGASEIKSAINAPAMLAQAFAQTPNYMT